jgi:ribosome maturation factor RimP
MDLEGLVRPVVESAGLEMVEVGLHREQGRQVVRVTVDREGGLDLDAIAELSERISRRLDLEAFDPGPYSLEVSSPGVERALRDRHDFARRVGERVRVKTARPLEGSRRLSGTIVEAGPDRLGLATERGVMLVPYQDITSARTEVDWDEELRRSARRDEGDWNSEGGGR